MVANPFKETPGTVASKILMLRAAQRKAIMIVEGTHDARVMANFVDAQSCLIVVACGKENVLGALPRVREREPEGIICIVDRDFDFIGGTAVDDVDVIYVDCHDLDLMILKSPALEKVLRELGSSEKLELFREQYGDIRAYLLNAAKPIGWLRLHSIEESAHLNFNNMSFNFVQAKDLGFELAEMVREVLNRSRRPSSQLDIFVQKISEIARRSFDLWDVCVAEDVLQILTHALCKMIGSQQRSKIDWRVVQTHLRLAYERDFFRGSMLCARIQEWETRQSPFTCLALRMAQRDQKTKPPAV